MNTRKYLFESKWKQYLAEQAEGNVIRIGVSTVTKAKVQGNTISFKVRDLDQETISYALDMVSRDAEIVLTNSKLNPATSTTHERYTISKVTDISIDGNRLDFGANYFDEMKRRLLYYFEQ